MQAVRLVPSVRLVLLERLVLSELQVHLVLSAQQDLQVQPVSQEPLVPRVSQDRSVCLVRPVSQDLKERKETREWQALMAVLDRQDP